MIRRFLTRILILVLLAFCGYNWVQMRALQAQVAELQRGRALPDRRGELPSTESDLSAWLSEANRHEALARVALARSDWNKAHQELQEGIADLNRAASTPDARRELTNLQAQIQQLQEESRVLLKHRLSQ